jgi:hypothetical protein
VLKTSSVGTSPSRPAVSLTALTAICSTAASLVLELSSALIISYARLRGAWYLSTLLID